MSTSPLRDDSAAYDPPSDLEAYPPPGSRAFITDKTDPSATRALRQRFLVEVHRRWDVLDERLQDAIIEKNALGLPTGGREGHAAFDANPIDDIGQVPPEYNQPTPDDSAATLALFGRWLDSELEWLIEDPQPTTIPGQTGTVSGWASTYLTASYDHGVDRAGDIAAAAGADDGAADEPESPLPFPLTGGGEGGGGGGGPPPPAGSGGGFPAWDPVRDARHREAKAMHARRGYNEIVGVTAETKQRIGRVLHDSMQEGLGPVETARRVDDATGLGRQRTGVIARTEVIRGAAEAALNEYDRLGFEKTAPAVEFRTSDDSDVCDRCWELHEKSPYALADAHGQIPAHPNCRCYWLPLAGAM